MQKKTPKKTKNKTHSTTSLFLWCQSNQEARAFPVELVSENFDVSSQTNQTIESVKPATLDKDLQANDFQFY